MAETSGLKYRINFVLKLGSENMLGHKKCICNKNHSDHDIAHCRWRTQKKKIPRSSAPACNSAERMEPGSA